MNKMRQWMICLLLLTYVGQSLAAIVTPCAMVAPSTAGQVADDSGMLMPAGMDHSGHHMNAAADIEPGASSNNCCEGGLCSMSHCLAVAAIVPGGHVAGLGSAPVHFDALLVPTPFTRPTFLFRPPISR